jgi:hypothetical protein
MKFLVGTVGRGTGKIVEVEHAMLLTLSELGVDIPKKDFMTLVTDFVPPDALRPPK